MPRCTTSRAPGSAAVGHPVSRAPASPATSWGSSASTFLATASEPSVIGTSGYSAIGSDGSPTPLDTTPACCMNGVVTMDTLGTPALSAIAAARSTAGVHDPQAPTAEITASQPCLRRSPGSVAASSFSSRPWIEPNVSNSTKRMPG